MTDRILLIEDNEKLGAQMVEHLRQAGYGPFWWRTGRPLTADDAAQIGLLILDLMLPGTAGLDILKALREVSDVPVLILSARNDTLDKVRALKLGADDYMTKNPSRPRSSSPGSAPACAAPPCSTTVASRWAPSPSTSPPAPPTSPAIR